jgi:dTDP-4-dehydrorhamnose reductase
MKNILYSLKNSGNMKRIIILGSSGMAGRYIAQHLKRTFLWPTCNDMDIIEINREDNFDVRDLSAYSIQMRLKREGVNEDDVVINCIGTLKPRVDELGTLNAILVNSVFPLRLEEAVLKLKARLIHLTTDCVFSGKDEGRYSENYPHNAFDVYGKTKSLGEPPLSTVIRTSIIGEEKGRKQRSLLQWAIDNKGKSIHGFVNHYWNGITCLSLAKIIASIILYNKFWVGVKHVHSQDISKYELLYFINSIYGLDCTIIKTPTPPLYRTLRSVRKDIDFGEFDIFKDIKEQKDFNLL